MNTFIPLHRVVLLLSSLTLLGLSACVSVKSDPTKKKDTHTITITYDAKATPQWSYSIVPQQKDPKKALVKRGDTIEWRCDQGAWTIFFKGASPLTNPKDPCEGEQGYVTGAAGATVGALVTAKVKKGDEFSYGVSVVLPGATDPVVDDPRIIIEK